MKYYKIILPESELEIIHESLGVFKKLLCGNIEEMFRTESMNQWLMYQDKEKLINFMYTKAFYRKFTEIKKEIYNLKDNNSFTLFSKEISPKVKKSSNMQFMIANLLDKRNLNINYKGIKMTIEPFEIKKTKKSQNFIL